MSLGGQKIDETDPKCSPWECKQVPFSSRPQVRVGMTTVLFGWLVVLVVLEIFMSSSFYEKWHTKKE